MQAFTQHLFTVRDNARRAANEARTRLIQLLHDDQAALGPAIAEALHLQAYARWWAKVTTDIENGQMDAVTALINSRKAAHRILLDHVTPRSDCPFTYGQAVAALEATRHFYHDTTALEVGMLPHAGPTPPTTGTTTTPTGGRPAITPGRSM